VKGTGRSNPLCSTNEHCEPLVTGAVAFDPMRGWTWRHPPRNKTPDAFDNRHAVRFCRWALRRHPRAGRRRDEGRLSFMVRKV
jgi:hypothetical protein